MPPNEYANVAMGTIATSTSASTWPIATDAQMHTAMIAT